MTAYRKRSVGLYFDNCIGEENLKKKEVFGRARLSVSLAEPGGMPRVSRGWSKDPDAGSAGVIRCGRCWGR